jgi:putative intracellular protease/amidase
MARAPEDRRIAIWAADGVERVEPEQPRGVLHGAGALTDLLLIQAGEIQARHWIIDSAETFAVDREVSDASLDDYDALLLGRHRELRPAPDPRGRGRLRSRRRPRPASPSPRSATARGRAPKPTSTS